MGSGLGPCGVGKSHGQSIDYRHGVWTDSILRYPRSLTTFPFLRIWCDTTQWKISLDFNDRRLAPTVNWEHSRTSRVDVFSFGI